MIGRRAYICYLARVDEGCTFNSKVGKLMYCDWSKIWFNSLGISGSAKKAKNKNFGRSMNGVAAFLAVVLTGGLIAGFQDLITYVCIVLAIVIAIAYGYGSSKLATVLNKVSAAPPLPGDVEVGGASGFVKKVSWLKVLLRDPQHAPPPPPPPRRSFLGAPRFTLNSSHVPTILYHSFCL